MEKLANPGAESNEEPSKSEQNRGEPGGTRRSPAIRDHAPPPPPVGSGAFTLIVNVVNLLNVVLSFNVEKKISDVMASRDDLYIRVNAQKREGKGRGGESLMAEHLRTPPGTPQFRSIPPRGFSKSSQILRNTENNDGNGSPRR